MNALVAVILFTSSLFVAATPTAAPPPTFEYCDISLDLFNDTRHVYGDVHAECTYACSPLAHSHPFGNWGVESNVGPKFDAEQYMGWQSYNNYCSESLDPKEWNSCTALYSGSSAYFNWNNYTEQMSTGERFYGGIVRHMRTSTFGPDGCAELDGRMIALTGNTMTLYELDPGVFGGDEKITDLTIPDMYVTLSCPDWSHCDPVYSGWVNSNGNSVTSTRVRMRATGEYAGTS